METTHKNKDAKTRMTIVDDIATDICEKLEILTHEGALSIRDSIVIIKTLSGSQSEWMLNTFTDDEIKEFMNNRFKSRR